MCLCVFLGTLCQHGFLGENICACFAALNLRECVFVCWICKFISRIYGYFKGLISDFMALLPSYCNYMRELTLASRGFGGRKYDGISRAVLVPS
jgi:hypothetical protein